MSPKHERVKVVEIPRGSDRWFVRVNFAKHRKTRRYPTKERAEDVATKTRAALEAFGMEAFRMLYEAEVKPIPTVKEFADRWIAEISNGDLKRSTLTMYESNLRIHILPALGSLLVSDVDYAAVKAFMLSKREATYSSGRFRNTEKKRKYSEKAEDRKYSRDSIRIMVMTLRALLNEAVREKLLTENPCKDLAGYYRKRAKDKVVTRNDVYTLDELYKIEDQLRNRTLYGDELEMSLTMSRTGMRIGEARGLQWDDFDWPQKRVRVCRNIPSGIGLEEDSAKTPAGERWVEMSEELCAVLKALQARRKAEGLKTGRRGHGTVFAIRYDEFTHDWKRAQAQAGIRYRSPHSIRHTYASQMLMAGVNPAWLAKQMGHSSPNVTLTIYTHFVQDAKAQAVNVMDRINANDEQIGDEMQIKCKSLNATGKIKK